MIGLKVSCLGLCAGLLVLIIMIYIITSLQGLPYGLVLSGLNRGGLFMEVQLADRHGSYKCFKGANHRRAFLRQIFMAVVGSFSSKARHALAQCRFQDLKSVTFIIVAALVFEKMRIQLDVSQPHKWFLYEDNKMRCERWDCGFIRKLHAMASNQTTATNECEVGTYGKNCSEICHCKDAEPCDMSGVCPNGCDEGYTGKTCEVLIPGTDPTGDLVKVIAPSVMAGLGILTAAIAITVLMVKKQRSGRVAHITLSESEAASQEESGEQWDGAGERRHPAAAVQATDAHPPGAVN